MNFKKEYGLVRYMNLVAPSVGCVNLAQRLSVRVTCELMLSDVKLAYQVCDALWIQNSQDRVYLVLVDRYFFKRSLSKVSKYPHIIRY